MLVSSVGLYQPTLSAVFFLVVPDDAGAGADAEAAGAVAIVNLMKLAYVV